MNAPAAQFFVGVCWHCKANGSTIQPLQRCGGCQLVSYCSKGCQKNDWSTHKYVCKEFPVSDSKNVLHTTGPWDEHITSLLKRAASLKFAEGFATPLFLRPWVCNTCHEASRERLTICKCLGVSYCSRSCSKSDNLHIEECSQLHAKIDTCSVSDMCLAYPRSLLYALQLLPDYFLRLKDLSTLVVHVVTGKTMLDDMQKEDAMRLFWEEGFVHQFPKLKHLKMFFIMQGNDQPPFSLESGKIPLTCNECESKGRDLTLSLQQMKYHMFFMSDEYTEPDVVVVYGNYKEMLVSEEDPVQGMVSYSSMTYSQDTVVVMMDATKELVRRGITAMDLAQPIELLLPIQNNPLKGFTLSPYNKNYKCYFACLRRK